MVVISYRNDETVIAAVESLLGQSEPVEIVVSHSGDGRGAELVARRFPHIRAVTSEARRTPGAARNAGVQATEAPYIGFLAADCTASPYWATARVLRHRGGAPAVASAMAPPRGSAALAAYLLQHGTRMPHLTVAPHLRFGVSYERRLLLRYGPFREDLPGEEDVALNARLLAAGVEIAWAPEVLTGHAYVSTARELLSDQHRRGRLRQRARGRKRPRPMLLGRALLDGPVGLANAARSGSPLRRSDLLRAAPLVAAGTLATASGIATEPRPR